MINIYSILFIMKILNVKLKVIVLFFLLFWGGFVWFWEVLGGVSSGFVVVVDCFGVVLGVFVRDQDFDFVWDLVDLGAKINHPLNTPRLEAEILIFRPFRCDFLKVHEKWGLGRPDQPPRGPGTWRITLRDLTHWWFLIRHTS